MSTTAILEASSLDFQVDSSSAAKMTGATDLITLSGVGGNKVSLRGLSIPVQDSDAATKAYVDQVAGEGLDTLESAHAIATSALSASTYDGGSGGVGATLTASAAGKLTIDSQDIKAGERVVVNGQANQFENGIYLCTTEGTDAVPFVLTRSTDFNMACHWSNHAFVFIESGTLYANSGWVLSIMYDTAASGSFSSTKDSNEIVGDANSDVTEFVAHQGLRLNGRETFHVISVDAANKKITLNKPAHRTESGIPAFVGPIPDSSSLSFHRYSGAGNMVGGPGITIDVNEISVNVDTNIMEISGDNVRVKNGGIDTNQLATDAVTNDKLDNTMDMTVGSAVVQGDVSIGGATGIVGALSLTKASGTGLAVTASATIGGNATVTGDIAGANLNLSGEISSTNATTASSATDSSAAIHTAGGVAVEKDVFVGGALDTSGAANFGQTVALSGILSSSNSLQATGVNAAAATFDGGLGIAKKVIAGDAIELKNHLKMNGAVSGALTLAPSATTASYTITLPNAAPSDAGQVIRSTDTSGNCEWYTIVSTEIINGNSHVKIDEASKDIIHSVPSLWQHEFKVNSAEILAISGAGLDVTGTLDASGDVNVSSSTDASNSSGAIYTDGGISCAKSLNVGTSLIAGTTVEVGSSLDVTTSAAVGTSLTVGSTAQISDTVSALKATGTGLAVVANATVGGTLQTSGAVSCLNTLTSNLHASFEQTAEVKGVATLSDTTEATSSTAAGTIVKGGLAVAKKVEIGTDAKIGNDLTVVGEAKLQSAVTVTGASQLNNALSVTGIATFSNSTEATSATAASVLFAGGLGVSKKMFVTGASDLASTLDVTDDTHLKANLDCDGSVNFNDSTDCSSVGTAAAVLDGGLSVAKKIRAGDLLECKNSLSIKASTSGQITIAPAAATTDYTVTLPAVVGSAGQVLRSTDASGALEWYSIVSSEIVNGDSHIKIDVESDDIIHSVPSSKQHEFKVNAVEIAHISGDGINVSGTVVSSGQVDINNTSDSTGPTDGTASIHTLGGVSIEKSAHVGTAFTCGSTLAVGTNLTVSGLAGIVGAATLDDTLLCKGALTVQDSTDSSSTSTGCLKLSGGIGVAKSVYIGDLLDVVGASTLRDSVECQSTLLVGGATTCAALTASGVVKADANDQCTSLTTGALQTLGGAAITKNCHVGGSLTCQGNLSASAGAFSGNVAVTSGTASTSTTTGAVVINGGIGVTGDFHVSGDHVSSGDIQAATFTSISDERLKVDIRPATGSLAKLSKINAYKYRWNKAACKRRGYGWVADDTDHLGVMAQEIEQHIGKEFVHTSKHNGTKSVAYGKLTSLLIGAVKEQQATITRQDRMLKAMSLKMGMNF